MSFGKKKYFLCLPTQSQELGFSKGNEHCFKSGLRHFQDSSLKLYFFLSLTLRRKFSMKAFHAKILYTLLAKKQTGTSS